MECLSGDWGIISGSGMSPKIMDGACFGTPMPKRKCKRSTRAGLAAGPGFGQLGPLRPYFAP